jgi:hypothetical protein
MIIAHQTQYILGKHKKINQHSKRKPAHIPNDPSHNRPLLPPSAPAPPPTHTPPPLPPQTESRLQTHSDKSRRLSIDGWVGLVGTYQRLEQQNPTIPTQQTDHTHTQTHTLARTSFLPSCEDDGMGEKKCSACLHSTYYLVG